MRSAEAALLGQSCFGPTAQPPATVTRRRCSSRSCLSGTGRAAAGEVVDSARGLLFHLGRRRQLLGCAIRRATVGIHGRRQLDDASAASYRRWQNSVRTRFCGAERIAATIGLFPSLRDWPAGPARCLEWPRKVYSEAARSEGIFTHAYTRATIHRNVKDTWAVQSERARMMPRGRRA